MYERIMESKISVGKSKYGFVLYGYDVMSADMREILMTVPTMEKAKEELEKIVIQERLACPTGGCDD